MSTALSWALFGLIAGRAAAQSWTVTPSNVTTYTPDNATHQVVMTLDQGHFQFQLVPLTDQATWSLTVCSQRRYSTAKNH